MKKKVLLVILLILVIVLLLFRVKDFKRNTTELASDSDDNDSTKLAAIEMEYNLPVRAFNIIHGTLQPDEHISELLKKYHVADSSINQLTLLPDTTFDMRTVKSGNNYALFFDKKGNRALHYLVYEKDQVDYIVFDFSHTLHVEKKEREITTKPGIASGVISSSLWDCMAENDINPMVAMKLSEIYAWSIDFFGLRPGDAFKVIYEEQTVDTFSIGITRIYGAWFRHNGKIYYAIPSIRQHNVFYDENGKSMKKAFLKAPLKFSRISSKFTKARFHPILKIWRPHLGVDYCAPTGTPIHSVGKGKILIAKYSGGAGWMVKIKHGKQYMTSYMHMSHFARGIHTGASVSQGQVIGYVGTSGLATGPHLDFRFWKNGVPINPLKVISPPANPVKPSEKKYFNIIRNSLIRNLNLIPLEKSSR